MKNQKGFTLIELLVVIAIIGLLSTLAVVSLNNARARARDSKRIADVKQMQTALELFYNDCTRYPATNTPADDGGGSCPSGITLGTFMQVIPTAPTPPDGSCDNTTNPYTYAVVNSPSAGASYTIDFCIGADTGDLTAGALTATPAGIQ